MDCPATYYVIPEHHIYLSDDRSELIFDQHLPLVRKEDLNVEVLKKSICLDFKVEGKDSVARCFALPYIVEPDTATWEFKDNVLQVRVRLAETLASGKYVNLF